MSFDYFRSYDLVMMRRPLIMVEFRNEDRTTRTLQGAARVPTIVDSGSDVTMLQDRYAYSLGLDVTKLKETFAKGLGGRVRCTEPVPLLAHLCGEWVPVPVSFYSGTRSVLGRAGAFDALRITFVHKDKQIYAARMR
jgi:hypothetical protein